MKKWAILIFFAGLVVRLLIVVLTHQYRDLSTRGEIHRIAISIAEGHGFSDPYITPTGPSAHCAPGYPLVLAAIYRIAGTGNRGELSVLIFQSAMVGIVFASLPIVSAALGLPVEIGSAAGMFGAVAPIHYRQELLWGETVFAAMALILLAGLTAKAMASPPNIARAVSYGLTWGLALVFAPELLPVGIAWLALIIYFRFRHYGIHSAIQYCLIATLVCFACTLPWMMRNYIALGSPIAFRSNLGLELYLSNNDGASPILYENMKRGLFAKLHPSVSREQAELIRNRGEATYNSIRLHWAIDWMSEQPSRFLNLTFRRFLRFWFPMSRHQFQGAILSLMTALAGCGLIWLSRLRPEAAAIIGAIWITYPLIYYFIQAETRYRYPIYWTFLLLGTLVASRCLPRRVHCRG